MVMLSRPSRSRCLGTVDRQYEDSCKNEIRSYFIFLTDTVEYSVLHQNRKVQSSFSITAMLGRDESGRCREVAVTGTQGCNVTHFFREHIMLPVSHNGNNPIVNDIIIQMKQAEGLNYVLNQNVNKKTSQKCSQHSLSVSQTIYAYCSSINETKSTYILADKQAIEDELFIDGGKHVMACF